MHRAMERRWNFHGALLLAMALLTSCKFLEVSEQQRELHARCELEGSVETAAGKPMAEKPHPLIVVLLRGSGSGWQIADHYITTDNGRWGFSAESGDYGLLAFADDNSRARLEPGAAWPGVEPSHRLSCVDGDHLDRLVLHPTAAPNLDVIAKPAAKEQVPITLGSLTVLGVVTTLDDPGFAPEVADMGLWQPVEFLKQARPGIYFLQRYDTDRIPVLYVHGINGTPRNFDALIARLDRARFQPWVYLYPSSADLDVVGGHLQQTVTKLQRAYHFDRLVVIAHSMGGLPARNFILRNGDDGVEIPLFISLATPWGGNDGAAAGAEHAPTPLPAWIDLAPNSAFLRALFYLDPDQRQQPRPLPARTRHHLFFAFQRDSNSFGPSSDGTIPLQRQLPPEAQRDAERLYGIDAGHVTVLQDNGAGAQIDALLAQLPTQAPARPPQTIH